MLSSILKLSVSAENALKLSEGFKEVGFHIPEDDVTVIDVLMIWFSYWFVTTTDPFAKVQESGRVFAIAVQGEEGLMNT